MTQEKLSDPVSSYLQYLPAILQAEPFFGQFLLGFEAILSGHPATTTSRNIDKIIQPDTANPPGFEQIIEQIETYFIPLDASGNCQETPTEFLPWLASWVALTLRDDWSEQAQRAFIRQIISLYQFRGTKAGLAQILGLYLKNSGFSEDVEIYEPFESKPHYFQVNLNLPKADPVRYWRETQIAKAIINQEKPAHTHYDLTILVPSMRITREPQKICSFRLFELPPTSESWLEAILSFEEINPDEIAQLVTGNFVSFASDLFQLNSRMEALENGIRVQSQLTEAQFFHLPQSFNFTISQFSDRPLLGNITINLHVPLNQRLCSFPLAEQSFTISPLLKICQRNEAGEIVAGNTIIRQQNQDISASMQIPRSLEKQKFSFRLFDPATQKFRLEVTATISESPQVEMSKLVLRLKNQSDKLTQYYSQVNLSGNQFILNQEIDYEHFLANPEGFNFILGNLNESQVQGEIRIKVSFPLNGNSISQILYQQEFILPPITDPGYLILKLCQQLPLGDIDGNTIIGTTG